MICPNSACQRIVSPWDKTCKTCGTPLNEDHPVKSYQETVAGIVDRNRELSTDSKENETGRFKGSLQRGPDKNPNLDLLDHFLQEKIKRAALTEIFYMVLSNPHVMGNPKYVKKAQTTVFHYDEKNMRVNAFAAQDDRSEQHIIVILDGYLNFTLAVEAIFKVRQFQIFPLLVKTLMKNSLFFSPYELGTVLGDLDGALRNLERPFLSCFEVIAHEFGHICYNHVYGPGYEGMSPDEARNMERDADSFASSIINRSQFNKELFASHLMCCTAWALIEKVGGIVEPGTHPLASERLVNAVKANSALAESLGLNEDIINQILK